MKKNFGVKNRKMKTAEASSGFAAAWFLSAALFLLPLIASSCSDEPPPDNPGKPDRDRPESSVSQPVQSAAHAGEIEQPLPRTQTPAGDAASNAGTVSNAETASNGGTVVFPSNDAGERINRYYGKESVYSDGKSTPDSVSLLHIPDTDIVDYVVPEGYTAISSEVFKNCKKLESITIPDSVKTIEGGAFNEHKTLKRVSLPAGISIGGRAFYHCESLESVTVRKDSEAGASAPENAEIGDEAFAECRKLTHMEVPDGVKTIGVRAFDLCQAMKTIEIPDSVEKIEWCAFNHCNALEEVTLSANHPVSIGHNAFRYCYALRHFRFPPGVTQIEESVFAASGLQSVELCDGMKAIGEDAFGGCRKLREINLPDTLETIGYGAFRDCNSLNIPSMPANMKKIGNEAFLKTDELPLESLVKIVLESDTGGSPLSPNPNRPETVLPDRIETFAPAFDLSQRKLAFSPGNTRYHFTEEGVLIDDETKTLLRVPLLLDGHYTIPDGIRAIGPWAFRGCRIRSVTIPASVTSIGAGAFSKTCLEEVSIPASVTEFREEELVSGLTIPRQYVLDNQNIPLLDFEQGVFAYCPALKRVTLPETMKTIPTAMFSNCGSLEEITLPDGLAGIGRCAFMSSGLKEIEIPESTKSVAKNAFYGAPCAQKVQNQYKQLME